MPTHHEIPATPDNMVLGYFDAATPPVLDGRVRRHRHPALASGGRRASRCHPDPARVPADLLAGPRHAGARPRPALHHRPGPRRGRRARRHAAGRHPRPEVPPGLGLRVDPAAARHPAGRVHRLRDHPSRHRSRPRRLPAALGHRDPARPVLRHHGHGAARRPGAACGSPVPRAFGGNMDNKELQGRHDALPAGVQPPARCSTPATATACRATARSASPRSRPGVTGTFRLTVRKDLAERVALRRDARRT